MHSIHGKEWASYVGHGGRRLNLFLTCSVLVMLLCRNALDAQTQTAGELLDYALRLASLYNWADAAPSFSRAQQLFTEAGDRRNALYARLGLLRATIERNQGTLPAKS